MNNNEWITKYCFRKHNVYQNTKEAIKICLEDAKQWSEQTGIQIEFFAKINNRFNKELSNILKVASNNTVYFYKIHSHSIGYLEYKNGGYSLGNIKKEIKPEKFKMFMPQLTRVYDLEI